MTLVAGLVRSWVCLYTAGLSSEIRDARRAEIESDLWEHDRHNGEDGCGPDETAWQVFSRWLLGIPADLTWRLEQIGTTREPLEPRRGVKMTQSRVQKGAMGLTFLLALFYISIGFAMWTSGDFSSATDQVLFSLAAIAAGAVLLTGLLMTNRAPWVSAALIVTATVAMGGLLWWMLPIMGPFLLIVIVFAVFRARRFAREPRAAGSLTPRPS